MPAVNIVIAVMQVNILNFMLPPFISVVVSKIPCRILSETLISRQISRLWASPPVFNRDFHHPIFGGGLGLLDIYRQTALNGRQSAS